MGNEDESEFVALIIALPFSFATSAQHYALFPLALGQVLREYAVTELHMSLNAGKWDYDHWGYPEDVGVGTGVG